MTLKMYRMEDTERVRMKLREDRRKEVRDKFDREEELEKMREERMMKNKKWREKKFGSEHLSVEENTKLSDKEQRILNNRRWRESRERNERLVDNDKSEPQSSSVMINRLEMEVLTELICSFCQAVMGPPTLIYQCSEGHTLCQHCNARQDMKVKSFFTNHNFKNFSSGMSSMSGRNHW